MIIGSCCFIKEFIRCISFPIDGDSAVLSYLRFENLKFRTCYTINIPFTRFPPTSVNKIRQMISKHHLPLRLFSWISNLHIFWADENLLTSFIIIYIQDIINGFFLKDYSGKKNYIIPMHIYTIPIEYALARFEPSYHITYVWQANKINSNKQKVIYCIKWDKDRHPIRFKLISSEVINILYSKLCYSSLIYTK